MKESKKTGRPRKGTGLRVHISARVEESALELIVNNGGVQKFLDDAVKRFVKANSPKEKKEV